MEANRQDLSTVLGSSAKHFFAPVFQRRYVWGEDQLDELWQDIVICTDESRPHLLGTLVLESQEGNSKEFRIVDGQQRLTSLTLFLKAAQLRLLAADAADVDAMLIGKHLLNRRTVSSKAGEPDYTALRMSPAQRDRLHYFRIIVDGVIPRKMPEKSKVPAAFKFFVDRMRELDLEEVRKRATGALEQLLFVRILLSPEDDANGAFGNINGLGMHLTPAELSKDYVLSRHSVADANRLNDLYWKPLEADFPVEKQQQELIHIVCTLLAGTTSKAASYAKLRDLARNKIPGRVFEDDEAFLKTFREGYLAVRSATVGKTTDWSGADYAEYLWIRDNLVPVYGFGAKLLLSAIAFAHVQGRISARELSNAVRKAEEFLVKVYFNDESNHASTYLAKALVLVSSLRGEEFEAELHRLLFSWPGYPSMNEFAGHVNSDVESRKDEQMVHYLLLRIERHLSGRDVSMNNTELAPLPGTTSGDRPACLQMRQLRLKAGVAELETDFRPRPGAELGDAAAARYTELTSWFGDFWGTARC
jgi:hypothetical protein